MLQNIFTLLFALLDLFVLYILHYYLDEYCSQISTLNKVIAILSSFIPAIKNIKCSLILKPIQTSMQFGFLPNLLTSNAILNFILSMIIRLSIIAFVIVFPFSIMLIMKLSSFLNFIGLIISIYLLIELSWKSGIYFQYNLKYAQLASIIPGIIFIYYLLISDGILCKLSILLPILQFIITEKGSLITSLMIGIFMMQKSILMIYIIQSLLIYYIIFGIKNTFTRILIGLIISCSIDIKENSMTQILYFSIYILTLIKTRFRQTKSD
ncbi:unnamed protein product [Paramecium pentaurelia]|uniref:Uncharacterized protein n=1 Tax=Paramecium pentaurelia TaxID=43138 RepID=A0A8S1UCY9_9CILI|nr:unnamed protein product [Paramecium pentaurelia]